MQAAPATADTQTQSSADWFKQRFAQVLRLPASSPAIASLAAGDAVTDLKPLSQAITRSFTRTADPIAGRVSFGLRATPAASDDPELDYRVARLAASLLGAARTALRDVDPGLCLPGWCSGELGERLARIDAILKSLIDSAPRICGRGEALFAIEELSNPQFGLLRTLEDMLMAEQGLDAALDRGRALEAIGVAVEAVESVGKEIFDAAPLSASAWAQVIRRRGAYIGARVGEVRRALERAGLDQYELAKIDIGICRLPSMMLSDTTGGKTAATPPQLPQLNLCELLCLLETVPASWGDQLEQSGGMKAVDQFAGALSAILTEAMGKLAPVGGVGAAARRVGASDRLDHDSREMLATLLTQVREFADEVGAALLPPSAPTLSAT